MSSESFTPGPRSPWRAVLLGGGLVVLVAAVAGGGYWWWKHKQAPKPPYIPDVAVLELNNRGVGLMEQFKYDEAVDVFEQLVREAPDWVPGRINLGIALLNAGGTSTPESLARCRETFEEVLRRDPESLHGHYCLGLLLIHNKDSSQARGHFEAVLDKDPNDAGSWYHLGFISPPGSDEQTRCYRRAHELSPYLIPAVYGLAQNLRRTDPKKADEFFREFQKLNEGDRGEPLVMKYTCMGRYAEVIGHYAEVIGARPAARDTAESGPIPLFQPRELTVRLAPGARWAKASDLGGGTVGQVRKLVRARFGGTIVVLDYDGDGKPDLFLVGAVVEKGQVRNLLLRNEGGGKFVDVTAEAGLAAPHPTLGCTVGDFDNDGYPDLFLTGVGSQKLFRNNRKGGFEDVTARATMDKLDGVCLGAAFVDLDQDSDLDLVVARYAATPEEALKALKGEKVKPAGELAVFLNIGTAPPVPKTVARPPLSCRWVRKKDLSSLPGGPLLPTGLAVTDLEGDRDVDCVVLADQAPAGAVLNDRLLRFRHVNFPEAVTPRAAWNGALVLDVDHDRRSELFLVRAGKKPVLLMNRASPAQKDVGKWFEAADLNSPPLIQAVAVDLDLDSWTDVVGLSADHLPVLLHNDGGRLLHAPYALGRKEDWPEDLIALTAFDANGDGFPDLLAWSEGKGLVLHESKGNGNHGLQVSVRGFYKVSEAGNQMRCPADAVGVWLVAQAGDLWAAQENTTVSAGLGQSRQPTVLGLGKFPQADVLRLWWPDGTRQAALSLTPGPHRIDQDNRKPTSCPLLFAWDGERFAFVTDFLGAGSVGERGPDGSCRPPRPVESVKIEPRQLAPRDGEYVLQVAEPMDEITYLDRVRLVVVDHPAKLRVYPDERFHTGGPRPTQELIAFDSEVFPARATDHRGRDVTATLKAWDRKTADGFARRSWLGFAEEHFVELDFADRLASFKGGDRLVLCLAGWTDYPYPESIWAAHQAGVDMLPPVLEVLGPDGKWHKVCEAGFPAGLPKMMLLDVTGKLTGPRCKLRLRTNLRVYWDQAFVAAGCRTVPVGSGKGGKGSAPRATALDVSRATLSSCGLMQEYSPDGREPTVYAFDRYDNVPVVRPSGRLTRYGEVTELLRESDDRFVIFGPGDLLTLRFDAKKLPPLPAGWKRSFVLRTRGYCKDTGPFTAHGDTVEPLPFRAMRNYPPGPGERYPDTKAHCEYLEKYNTRAVKPDGFPPRRRR